MFSTSSICINFFSITTDNKITKITTEEKKVEEKVSSVYLILQKFSYFLIYRHIKTQFLEKIKNRMKFTEHSTSTVISMILF